MCNFAFAQGPSLVLPFSSSLSYFLGFRKHCVVRSLQTCCKVYGYFSSSRKKKPPVWLLSPKKHIFSRFCRKPLQLHLSRCPSSQYTTFNSCTSLPLLDNMAGLSDSMRFLKAEEFFAKTPNAKGPKSLTSAISTQSIDPKEPLRYAALLTFDQGSTCLFQFVTPQLWRLRFDPSAKNASDYSDANS